MRIVYDNAGGWYLMTTYEVVYHMKKDEAIELGMTPVWPK